MPILYRLRGIMNINIKDIPSKTGLLYIFHDISLRFLKIFFDCLRTEGVCQLPFTFFHSMIMDIVISKGNCSVRFRINLTFIYLRGYVLNARENGHFSRAGNGFNGNCFLDSIILLFCIANNLF